MATKKKNLYIAWHEYGSNKRGIWQYPRVIWGCQGDEWYAERTRLEANPENVVLVMTDVIGNAMEEMGEQLAPLLGIE